MFVRSVVIFTLNSIRWFCSKDKFILHRKYFRYFHKTNSIVFTTTSAIKRAKFHLSSIIITYVRLFGYAFYSSVDVHCQQCELFEE